MLKRSNFNKKLVTGKTVTVERWYMDEDRSQLSVT